MTRAIYVSADPVAGKPRAAALGCGWFPTVPPEFSATAPCAIVVGGNGVQVFPDVPPVAPATVLAAIAAAKAIDAAAAAAQAILDANAATLRGRAQAALATNATFLAIGTPTAGQAAAQSKALTRQVNGLIRLALDRLDSLADS